MSEERKYDTLQKPGQGLKNTSWVRPSIIIITIIFFCISAITWIWKIWGDWSGIMSAIFTISGAVSAFFAIPFFYSSDRRRTASDLSDASKFPHVTINVAPNVNITPQQTLSLQTLSAEAKASNDGEAVPSGGPEASKMQEEIYANANSNLKEEVIPEEFKAIFRFNERLADPRDFLGRVRECTTLINRTYHGESTSIVGSRRIGKSWLIQYLLLVSPTKLGSRFHIGYLDATSADCTTIEGFIIRILEEWHIPISNIDRKNLGLATIEKVIRDFRSRKRMPVICIDEFENFGNRQEFDLNFFGSLRAMSQVGLSLVVASKTPLIDFIGDYGKTSGFFNIFEQLILKPFSAKESEVFAQTKGIEAGFTDEEKQFLLQYGQENGNYWPIRLQLVGKMMLEDKFLAIKEKDSSYYRPWDPTYWFDFQQRLEEKYHGVVKT
jgi:hypothetical protein